MNRDRDCHGGADSFRILKDVCVCDEELLALKMLGGSFISGLWSS